jgi:hypothetical protein
VESRIWKCCFRGLLGRWSSTVGKRQCVERLYHKMASEQEIHRHQYRFVCFLFVLLCHMLLQIISLFFHFFLRFTSFTCIFIIQTEVIVFTTLKIRVFWDIAPCSLVKVDRLSEVRTAFIRRVMNHHPEDGGSTHLWNGALLQWDYTALYLRKLSSSCSHPW